MSLRQFIQSAGIRKAVSLSKQLMSEPRYAWQILTGLPIIATRHLLFGNPILYIRRYAGIGDIICTFPSLKTLRRTEPQAVILYETRRHTVLLVTRSGLVDVVVENGSPLARVCQKLFHLKLDLYPLLPDEYEPKRCCDRIHLVQEFRQSFGLPGLDEESPRLEVNAKASKRINKWLQREGLRDGPLVIIHTGPTWKTREWPVEHWSELVARLSSELGAAVIQIGQDALASGNAGISPRAMGAIDLIGRLSLDEMLALLKAADLFVGIDSGMLHMAGAVRTSCVGIFGPVDPSCRLPTSSPAVGVTAQVPCIGCQHNASGPGHWMSGCPHDVRCMSELAADEVFLACSNYLKMTPRIKANENRNYFVVQSSMGR
jgi:ADP-heptose:LPS heptosyltransferase